MAIIGSDITTAVQILNKGELVAIPTETVYGLAGNALNENAVAEIFKVKNRPTFDPLIVHVSSPDQLQLYAAEIPAAAQKLVDAFWPGPLTILLKRKPEIPDLVTSGLDRAGFRCPDHPLTLSLLRSLSFPVAAPSANPFGYISPTTAEHVDQQLGKSIDYILNGGPCAVGVESTIIGFEEDGPVVYRLGGISLEQIEQKIGKVRIQVNSGSQPAAPGQLTSHYAPKKKLVLGDVRKLIVQHQSEKFGILSFNHDYGISAQRILSPSGDLSEAARNLFRYMRELDQEDITIILAEEVPHEGLGLAINDRLKRASA